MVRVPLTAVKAVSDKIWQGVCKKLKRFESLVRASEDPKPMVSALHNLSQRDFYFLWTRN